LWERRLWRRGKLSDMVTERGLHMSTAKDGVVEIEQ